MDYSIILLGKPFSVAVTQKPIKSVRLKVFPSCEIKLSVPLDTPTDWIETFLLSKTSWMEEKLIAFEKTRAIEKELHIQSGTSTRLLGRQLIIRVVTATRKHVEKVDNELFLYTPFPNNQDDIDHQFNNWWQKTSKQYYLDVLEKLYPIVQKHGVGKPKLVVKKMQTLWGSCSIRNSNININYYLMKAPAPCIEYVLLHELSHFLYSKHNKDFYDFITIHMPDWNEREKLLNNEIVLGI